VSAAADYTPAPCGTALGGPSATANDTATWRAGATVVQVRQLTYTTPNAAKEASAAFTREAGRCPSWLEAGATLQAEALAVPGAKPAPTFARHVARFDVSGRTESAWTLTVSGRHILSLLATRPSAAADRSVDEIVVKSYPKVLSRASR
jgi:hypothetical protein